MEGWMEGILVMKKGLGRDENHRERRSGIEWVEGLRVDSGISASCFGSSCSSPSEPARTRTSLSSRRRIFVLRTLRSDRLSPTPPNSSCPSLQNWEPKKEGG